ncbi:MAG TPA: leucyl aminopeptidase [Hyphomicrobiaceae bacterium]|nr:leucyl aminopeptidase [Hyphomicrobiaceae bacterium]
MSTNVPEIRFASLSANLNETTLLLVGAGLALGTVGRDLDQRSGGVLIKAAGIAAHTGKTRQNVELFAPPKLGITRLILQGAGKDFAELDRISLGGQVLSSIKSRNCEIASVVADIPAITAASAPEFAAELAYGMLLRSYEFKKYQTSGSKNDDNGSANASLRSVTIHTNRPEQAAEIFKHHQARYDGVALARDLVNEPANALGPVEFAERIRELTGSGLEVEIFDVPALEKIGMGALLAVGQGSARPARVAVIQWHGAKSKRTKPLCFIGKGVVFDSGGLSMKPAAGMEDMKGDMAGAACVTGLMLTLARRKAPVNAVGVVGLVENMPSHMAQRPGDVVRALSGNTIEVLNTDAEGRLVLADLLWYSEDRFKPRFMIDLATLTGAIMVALGKEHAGLFSNDDALAGRIVDAGLATGERVWRMPLDKAYDRLIDSKIADMKNIGGRFGGAITAAQFLQRFVRDTPWAHLDIAGTAMDSAKTDISQSWASGWGVRLLDKLAQSAGEPHEAKQ